MAKILRFEEPSSFSPISYRGLDQLAVFIAEEGGTSYDYFGFTNVPDELTAGRNLLSFTGTKNLVPGAEIAIEVLDANGDLIPVKTHDHIGFGNERVFSIEVDEKVPEGDALISVVSIVKGKVGYNARSQRDLSQLPPRNFRNRFNIRWQKRLSCSPRKRNVSDIVFFPNPDITITEVKRPYFKLHYNADLTSSYANNVPNSGSEFSLVSTASISDTGFQNTSASLRYEVQGDKYYVFCDDNPDFGGFTEDMVGGILYFPNPRGVFPRSSLGPYSEPIYNALEDGDGQGELDSGSATAQYKNQGAYNTYIMERMSPLQIRVNSPHTTFQGFGRANQQEVFHQRFTYSDFRLDWAQSPVSRSNPLATTENEMNTSYALIEFNNLTPLVGDVSRIKTYIRSDQTVGDYFLVGDNPVFAPELLVQSSSKFDGEPAGDFSQFGVSASFASYWTASGIDPTSAGPVILPFKPSLSTLANPMPEALQIGDSFTTNPGVLNDTNYWIVESKVPIVLRKDKYYEVSFKSFAFKHTGSRFTPNLEVYIDGPAVNDTGDDVGKQIGIIEDVSVGEFITEEDYYDQNISKGTKFTFKADGTEFGFLKFKINHGLWYISNVSVKPFDKFGYTPHYYSTIIPTPKHNVETKDALDFKFEFYNDDHRKATYTSEIKNVEFDNEYVFTATTVHITNADITNFIGNTPVGDNDWVRTQFTSAIHAEFSPALTESIYHSGSVGIGDFSSTNVNYPLHIKKENGEGNTTVKLESYSSSILHIASDVGGAGPGSRSAFILFDQNNEATSSIIGYTDKIDVDPGGATMLGVTQGSFVIHERHARVLALGVGGTTPLQLATGKSSNFRNQGYGGVFIGWKHVVPGSFAYELDVSGSQIIRSGTLFLPDSEITTSAGVNYLLGSEGSQGRTKRVELAELTKDLDWHIQPTYISQSRIVGESGRTVFIGDNEDVNGTIAPNSYIFQVSQSGTAPRLKFEGIPQSTVTHLIGVDSSGNVFVTESAAVGGTNTSGGGGDDGDWHVHSDGILTGSRDVQLTGSISMSGVLAAARIHTKFAPDGDGNIGQAGSSNVGNDVNTLEGSLFVGEMAFSAQPTTIKAGAESLVVGKFNHMGTANARALMVGLENSQSLTGHGAAVIGTNNENVGGDQTLLMGSYNYNNGSDVSALIGQNNKMTGQGLQYAMGLGLHASGTLGGQVFLGRYNTKKFTEAFLTVAGGDSDGSRLDLLSVFKTSIHNHQTTTVTMSQQGRGVGIGIFPEHPLDVLEAEDEQHPVRIRTLNKGNGSPVTYDANTGILMYQSSDGPSGPIKFNQAEFNVMFLAPSSPTMQFVSGSLQLIHSTAATSSNQGYYTGSAIIGEVKTDPNDDNSFYISSSINTSASMYFSGSGRVGIGTTDPKSDFDVVADEVRFRRRAEDIGLKMNKEGNLESFANTTAGSATGSELILNYSRGSSDVQTRAQAGDTIGSVRFVATSGSTLDPKLDARGSGDAGSIKVQIATSTVAGVTGKMIIGLPADPGAQSQEMITIDGPTQRIEFSGSGGAYFQNQVHTQGDIEIGDDIRLKSDSSALQFGADNDVSFTHVHNAGVQLNADRSIFFRDAAIGISSQTDGFLELKADSGIDLTSKLTVAGDISASGNLIMEGFISASSINSRIISSSILFSSGSNIFGDESTDTHAFTGTVSVTGSGAGHITSSGNISASLITGTHTLGGKTTFGHNTVVIDGVAGQITASGNISTSANVYAADFYDNGVNINTLYVQNSQTASFLGSGIISGSSQLPSGIVSSSAQLPSGIISSSLSFVQNSATTSFVQNSSTSSFVLNSQTGSFLNSGILSSSAQLPSGIISSSAQLPSGILSSSLSFVQNSATLSFVQNSSTSSFVVNSQTGSFLNTGIISGSSQLPSGIISSSQHVFTAITSSGTISSSQARLGEWHFAAGTISHLDASNPVVIRALIHGVETFQFGDSTTPNPTKIVGTNVELDAPVTTSGNISASGDIYAKDYYDDGVNINTIYVKNSQTQSFLGSGIVSGSSQINSLINDTIAATIVAEIDNGEIPIAKLAEDAITIAGNSTDLGGSITAATILQGTSVISSSLSFVQNSSTSSFVVASQTASFVQNSSTSSFVLNSQTGSFLNSGILSSSAQLPSGIISSSAQINSLIDDTIAATIVGEIDAGEIPITKLAEDAITIAGNATDLGGSITAATILQGTNVISSSLAFVQNASTLSFVQNSATTSFVQNSATLSFVQNSATTSFVQNSSTSSFVLNSQTGSFLNTGIVSSSTQINSLINDTIAATIVAEIDNNEIPIAKLAQDAITIAGNSTALGGSITAATILQGTNVISSSLSFVQNSSTSSFVLNSQTASFLNSGIISSSQHIFTALTSSGGIKAGAGGSTPIFIEPGLISFNPDANGSGVNFKVDDANSITYFRGNVEFEVQANKIELGTSANQHVTASGNIKAGGTITATGAVHAADLELPSGGIIDWANGDARIVEGETNNYSLTFKTYDGSGCSAALRLDGKNEATFIGHVTASGNISSSGNIVADYYDAKTSGVGYKLSGVKIVYLDSSVPAYTFGRDAATRISGSTIELSGGHVTASGNISSSGDIYAADYYDNGVNIKDIYAESATTLSLVQNSATLSFVQNSATTSFVQNSSTSSFVLNSQTGSFLNSGILSSSAQLPSGIVSSSTQINSLINDTIAATIVAEIDAGEIPVSKLAENTITIAGQDTGLGETITQAGILAGSGVISSSLSFVQNSATLSFVQNSQTASFLNSGIISSSQHVFTALTSSGTISGSVVSASTAVHTPILNGSGTDTMLVVQGHITASGNISASGYIYAGGDIHAVGDVVASSTTPSDYRLKENIQDIENPIDIIKELSGKSFNWKRTGEFDYGLIAQEVEKILPDLVKEKDDISGVGTKKVVKYISMIPILIESLKRLDDRNNSLETKLDKLIEQIDKLKNN